MVEDGDDMTPHDAFALLGHDFRVEILLELSDADGRALPFTHGSYCCRAIECVLIRNGCCSVLGSHDT